MCAGRGARCREPWRLAALNPTNSGLGPPEGIGSPYGVFNAAFAAFVALRCSGPTRHPNVRCLNPSHRMQDLPWTAYSIDGPR